MNLATPRTLRAFADHGDYFAARAPECAIDLDANLTSAELDAEFCALASNYPLVFNERGDLLVRFAAGCYHPMRLIPGHDAIRPFALGRYPVTCAEWLALTGSLPREVGKPSSKPITYVSALDAETALQPLGLRLPTEAEWVFAAYGSDGRTYPWGDEEPDDTRLVWSGSAIHRSGPAPVGTCPRGASPFGCEDMAGNVWEWTATPEGKRRVLRGGSWLNYDPSWVRAGDRNRVTLSLRNGYVGFRCSRSLVPA